LGPIPNPQSPIPNPQEFQIINAFNIYKKLINKYLISKHKKCHKNSTYSK
jgi:hypothetical protein